jgi:hypothetical protein
MGRVCALSCVEPCQTSEIRSDAQTKQIELAPVQGKCLHVDFYYLDRESGLMHVRLQSWAPFAIPVYVHGREYLARRMTKAGIDFQPRDNGFRRMLQGFRNKDLRRLLAADDENDPVRRHRSAGRITRQLRLLRAHGLIREISKASYDRIMAKEHQVMTPALRIRELDVAQIAA